MRNLNKLVCLTALLALVYAIPVVAQIDNQVSFQAPFAFYAGNAKLPAGNYRVTESDAGDNTLLIESTDGAHSVFVDYEPSDSPTPAGKTEITFKKYGDNEFISAISIEGNDSRMTFVPSKAEKKASTNGEAATHALSAKKGK